MGRTREFDREAAIEQAMILFWQHGYTGTSIDALLKKMNIKNSSFYQAFTSKEDLFIEVLQYYRRGFGFARLDILNSEKLKGKEALYQYFDNLAHRNYRRGYPMGCFMTNTAASIEDTGSVISREVSQGMRNLERAFVKALRRGQKDGELRKGINVEHTAGLLLATAFGLSVLGRTKKSKKEILTAAHALIDVLTVKS